MYQLFIAGIAYLNSLWQAADQGWTIVDSYVEALLDVQVCTSVMSSLSGDLSLLLAMEPMLTVLSNDTRFLESMHSFRDALRADHTPADLKSQLDEHIPRVVARSRRGDHPVHSSIKRRRSAARSRVPFRQAGTGTARPRSMDAMDGNDERPVQH